MVSAAKLGRHTAPAGLIDPIVKILSSGLLPYE